MKGLRKVVALILLGVLFLTNAAWAKWLPGIVHCHSRFSNDANRMPDELMKKAADEGAVFLVVTDHYDEIEKQGPKLGNFLKQVGFDNYLKAFPEQPSPLDEIARPLCVIAGAEVTLASHTLALGEIIKDDQLLAAKTQQGALTRLKAKEMGFLSVAAHPSINKYRYDKNAIEGLDGIEFFNDGGPEGYKKTRDWYLELLKKGKKVFVTAGCDSHNSADLTQDRDKERWQRKTWVECDKPNKDSIIEAFRKGRTYASRENVRLEDPSFQIGFETQEQKGRFFSFFIFFEEPTKVKTVTLYRDGEKVCSYHYDEYWQEHPELPGFEKKVFHIDDGQRPSSGNHAYVIEIDDLLITSPITVNVK